MPWPDVTEFTEFLQAAGLYGTTPTALQLLLDLEGALDAAVETWNDETRYWPFLSTGVVTEVRTFSPGLSPILDFNGGLVTLTRIVCGVTYSDNASQGGSEAVQSTDFFLRPRNAPQQGKPWTYLEAMRGPGWGLWGGWADSIHITGEWGYCNDANLPKAARRAVMEIAAQSLMPQIQMQLSRGGLSMLQEGDSTKRWSDKLAELRDFWQGAAERTIALYRRGRMA